MLKTGFVVYKMLYYYVLIFKNNFVTNFWNSTLIHFYQNVI